MFRERLPNGPIDGRPWVARMGGLPPKPNPTLRLFCFHHAGGNFNDFRKWETLTPMEVQICPIVLPGHTGRMNEKCVTNAPELGRAIAAGIEKLIDRPYAMFGHSMGSFIAFETARALIANGLPAPAALIMTSTHGPKVPMRTMRSHITDDNEFIATMARDFNDTTLVEAAAQFPEMIAGFLSVLRSDIKLVEDYTYIPTDLLNVPIHTYLGSNEKVLTIEDVQAWQDVTTLPIIGPTILEGDHFWPKNEQTAQQFVQKMTQILLSSV
ncbi:alpha/beta fold hydrolase [Pelomyxa schiedti]|nr:alpha/beta fold hydrolase [Pelomyxa schiedti]